MRISLVAISILIVSYVKAQTTTLVPIKRAPQQSGIVAEVPSPRSLFLSWQDKEGNLWIFGGYGYDAKNEFGVFRDFWKYDIASNTWKTLTESKNKVAINNDKKSDLPLPRADATTWVDQNGYFWLYGGNTGNDLQNWDDMWRYNPKANKWDKIDGEEKLNKKNSEAILNPGSRSGAASWVDESGALWFFGGQSFDIQKNGLTNYHNDLWTYDTKANQWRLVKGTVEANKLSDSKEQRKAPLLPSPRSKACYWYKDNRLWLYGGVGYDYTYPVTGGLSDLWYFDVATKEWVLQAPQKVLNAEPTLYTVFTGSPNNNPGSRVSASCWIDAKGELNLIGGHNRWEKGEIDLETRLWKYNPDQKMWRTTQMQFQTDFIGAGKAFESPKKEVYLFGGNTLNKETYQSQPSNAIWLLSTQESK